MLRTYFVFVKVKLFIVFHDYLILLVYWKEEREREREKKKTITYKFQINYKERKCLTENYNNTERLFM